MNKVSRIIVYILVIAGIILLVGCGELEKDYRQDICVQLNGRNAEIVIKEWSFLQGSGAEIYCRQNGKMTLLGKTTGGDDGYCPFEHGKYSISVDEETLHIRWAFRSSDLEKDWREATFALPTN